MSRLTAHLPHPGIALIPAPGCRSGQPRSEALNLRVQVAELLLIAMEGVEQLTVHIELGLRPCAVADAHRSGMAPAGEVRQLAFAEVVLPADAIHNLQRMLGAGTAARRAGHERDEVGRLVRHAADAERL